MSVVQVALRIKRVKPMTEAQERWWKRKYRAEIRQWDWNRIKAEVEREGGSYLGTVMALYPSGTYYMPWCSNVPEENLALKDELFGEALDEVAEEHGLCITSGEDDPCDVLAIDPNADDEDDDYDEEDKDDVL